ncbi:MAG: flagellin lysine-N-methylase [Clostridia bacterium]|nr:flagellin lysine-N-methylase [Clostridia bacterium]
MKEVRDYLVPDYYPQFSCKMGACRHACCEGWPISFTMNDYFKLLSIECSPELRVKLDCALHLAEHPTPEGYAQILPRYDGKCPMHLPDGRCWLHAELGEEVLAAVCRLYPRGVRNHGELECSCANSCEAVLELLMKRDAPLGFRTLPLEFDLPDAVAREHHFETMGREEEIRLWLISFLKRREYPLPRRILFLGEALKAMDDALQAKDENRVDALLTGAENIHVPEDVEAGQEQLRFGLDAASRMLEIMDERSDSIREYGEAALRYFSEGEVEFRRYILARARFEALVPNWQNWFEHMLVNHMYFTQVPFQDRPVDLRDEYLALCAVYALLRFLSLGWMAQREDIDSAVDVAAAAFRLIEHTEFDRYAAPILKHLGCDDWVHLRQLLCL